MKFKRYITIFLLSLFSLLTLVSTQAGDLPGQMVPIKLSSLPVPSVSAAPASPGYVAAIGNYIENKTSFIVNPIGIIRYTYNFGKNHPIITSSLICGSFFGYLKYSAWYNKNANSLTEISNFIHSDYNNPKLNHAVKAISAAERYRTWCGLKNHALIDAVKKFYNENPKRSYDNYTTIIKICGANIALPLQQL